MCCSVVLEHVSLVHGWLGSGPSLGNHLSWHACSWPPFPQVILSLRAALRVGGVPEKELESCLLPVDLARDHQLYLRVDE